MNIQLGDAVGGGDAHFRNAPSGLGMKMQVAASALLTSSGPIQRRNIGWMPANGSS